MCSVWTRQRTNKKVYIEQVEIDVVEIDEAVVSVATDWFNFTTDDRLRISVADGLEYIQQLDRTGN